MEYVHGIVASYAMLHFSKPANMKEKRPVSYRRNALRYQERNIVCSERVHCHPAMYEVCRQVLSLNNDGALGTTLIISLVLKGRLIEAHLLRSGDVIHANSAIRSIVVMICRRKTKWSADGSTKARRGSIA